MSAEAPKSLGRYALHGVYFRSYYGALYTGEVASGDGAGNEVVVRLVEAEGLDVWDYQAVTAAAAAFAGKEHPNLVSVRDVVEGATAGVISDPFEGDTLRNLLRQLAVRRKNVSIEVALRIALDMLEGLRFVHGLAADLPEPERAFGGLTLDGFVIGSDGRTRLFEPGVESTLVRLKTWQKNPKRIGYDAPELGTEGVPATARADVFTIGAILWEILIGKRVAPGATAEAIAKRFKQGPLPRVDAQKRPGGDDVPSEIADVVAQALEIDTAARFAGTAPMAAALAGSGLEPASHDAVQELIGSVGSPGTELEFAL